MKNCDLVSFPFVGGCPSAPEADFKLERLSFLLKRIRLSYCGYKNFFRRASRALESIHLNESSGYRFILLSIFEWCLSTRRRVPVYHHC